MALTEIVAMQTVVSAFVFTPVLINIADCSILSYLWKSLIVFGILLPKLQMVWGNFKLLNLTLEFTFSIL